MAQTEYWLWFQKIFMGSTFCKKLMKYYNFDPVTAFGAIACDDIPLELQKHIKHEKVKAIDLSDMFLVMKTVKENGWQIITFDSEYYPSLLREISDPPMVLFCSGNMELLKKHDKIAVVGTRNADDSVRTVSFKLGLHLSESNVCVVSGGAQGVDSCAHEGALSGNGGTVAILGCGLGNSYTKKMGFLKNRIEKYGLFVTENFPFDSVRSFSFPKRNRLISGMSLGVAVTSAGEKSGSLITAELAGKQKRKVFALDSSVFQSRGCEQLIEKGAVPFDSADVIMNECKEKLSSDALFTSEAPRGLKSHGLEGKLFLVPELLTEEEYESRLCVEDNEVEFYYNRKKPSLQEEKKRERKQRTASAVKSKEKPELSGMVMPENVVRKDLPSYLSDEAHLVYDTTEAGEIYIDLIQSRTNLTISKVLQAVTELELEDLIKTMPGSIIKRI